MENRYRTIRNKYLAEGLAFLGFKYRKFGFGEETEYSFEDTKQLHETIGKILTIKKELKNN